MKWCLSGILKKNIFYHYFYLNDLNRESVPSDKTLISYLIIYNDSKAWIIKKGRKGAEEKKNMREAK